ncbi:hypothetical protein KUTG_00778 [Kutzneria sp. 744]|nr:hypothetical protein KUTG_00778 [Kutzneria sp. 744]
MRVHRDADATTLPHDMTSRQLDELVRWIDWHCHARGRDNAVPLVGGRPWKLSVTQFRRTLPGTSRGTVTSRARSSPHPAAGADPVRHLGLTDTTFGGTFLTSAPTLPPPASRDGPRW